MIRGTAEIIREVESLPVEERTLIVDYPTVWPETADGMRHCLVYRFTYGVLYSIELHGMFTFVVTRTAGKTD